MGFSYLEKKAFKNGFKIIAGADEAGRGSLAGPVAAAIVIAKPNKHFPLIKQVKDSKQLSTKQRELIFEKIKQEPSIEWKVSFVGPSVIDKINILQATKLAWKNCLKKLDSQPDFLFIDGNQGIKKLNIEQQTIIKGDQKIFLVSLASIIAKVSRDKLMERLDLKYPEYNFKQHKGYGTKLHLKNLKKFGPCTIHRKSFRPICKI
ncbi:ribonuclease HII [Patescibacteria group bacterium]|nr:ribonuclease HII [Patescibacteria group bacterium]